METQLLIRKKQTINKDVKICVECGGCLIHKAKQIVFCKEGGRKLSDNSCRSVCRYYDANSSFRNSDIQIFRKYCNTCNLDLVSRYSRCPCCHDIFGNGDK